MQDPWLPPGCTQEMCDTAGGSAMDENTLCSCGHKLAEHDDEENSDPCNFEECECKDFDEDNEEPDWGDLERV